MDINGEGWRAEQFWFQPGLAGQWAKDMKGGADAFD